jgi:Flp pilus assembly protein TadD
LFDYALLHDLLGNKSAARAGYIRYLAVVPDDPRALNNLAWILATDPRSCPADRAEALSLARRAVEIDSSDRLHSGTLAVALIVNGDTRQGRILAEKSIALSRAAGDEKSASLVEAWLPKSNPPAIIKAPAHKK